MTEYGFVYALTNKSMPGLVKIGYTTKHPRTRMAELSKSTACATPFDLLAYFGTEEPANVERVIHRALDEFRVNGGREFFNCTMYDIQDEFRKWADSTTDAFYSAALDHEVDAEWAASDAALGIVRGTAGSAA